MRGVLAVSVGLATVLMVGDAASAQTVVDLPLTVSATCDGEVTARYDFAFGDPVEDLTNGTATFTSGAVVDTQTLTDVPANSVGAHSETLTSTGWAVGDVVDVRFAFTYTSDASAVGTASVEIPECVVVTDPPVTDPPVTEPPVTDPPVTEPPVTEPPVTEPPVTEPPVTEPPATDPPAATVPPTLPATVPPTLAVTGSDDTTPTGLVAAALAAAGAVLVVLARRRAAS